MTEMNDSPGLSPADGEAEGGVGEDSVFLERAGSAAVAAETAVSGVKAEPCVSRSGQLELMRSEHEVKSRIRQGAEGHDRTTRVGTSQAVRGGLKNDSSAEETRQ